MNYSKCLGLLKKINLHFDNLSTNPNQISKLEADLLKKYIIEFYEHLSTDNQQKITVKPFIQPKKEISRKTEIIQAELQATSLDNIITEHLKMNKTASQSEKTTASKITEVHEAEAPKQSHVPEVIVEEKVQAQDKVKVEEKAELKTTTLENNADANIVNQLFQSAMEGGPSSYQAQKWSKPLSQAFGLNDRIHYSKRLFGDDQSKMAAVIKSIDELKEFDAVKNALNESITSYQWTAPERIEIAAAFIRIIYQKYI